jgi:hypothetical protein
MIAAAVVVPLTLVGIQRSQAAIVPAAELEPASAGRWICRTSSQWQSAKYKYEVLAQPR